MAGGWVNSNSVPLCVLFARETGLHHLANTAGGRPPVSVELLKANVMHVVWEASSADVQAVRIRPCVFWKTWLFSGGWVSDSGGR